MLFYFLVFKRLRDITYFVNIMDMTKRNPIQGKMYWPTGLLTALNFSGSPRNAALYTKSLPFFILKIQSSGGGHLGVHDRNFEWKTCEPSLGHKVNRPAGEFINIYHKKDVPTDILTGSPDTQDLWLFDVKTIIQNRRTIA